MKHLALGVSIILLLMVVFGALRTVFQRRYLFLRPLDETTHRAYTLLAILAAGLFAYALLDLHVDSVEIAGVKASVGELKERVDTLSDQMEAFFKRKRIEVFDRHNWDDRVTRVARRPDGSVILQVTLEQEPIPGSVEVLEGVLPMPEQDYQIEGRVLKFPANTDKPTIGITIKYYPRVPPVEKEAHP